MASRKLSDLSPLCRSCTEAFIQQCTKEKIDILVTCTYRSDPEQAALYAQGRETLNAVNKLREKVSLVPISKGVNYVVTNCKAGQSKHNHCEFLPDRTIVPAADAIDVVPMNAGKCIWNAKNPIWQTIGKIGQTVGLKWAGNRKKFKEYPHFEI